MNTISKIDEIKRRGNQELDLVESVVGNDVGGILFPKFVMCQTIRDSLYMINTVFEEISQIDTKDDPEMFGDRLGETFIYVGAINHFSKPLNDKRLNRVLKRTIRKIMDFCEQGFNYKLYERYANDIDNLLRMTRKYEDASMNLKLKILNGER